LEKTYTRLAWESRYVRLNYIRAAALVEMLTAYGEKSDRIGKAGLGKLVGGLDRASNDVSGIEASGVLDVLRLAAADEVIITADSIRNAVLVRARSKHLDRLVEEIRKIDQPRDQVLLDVVVLETTFPPTPAVDEPNDLAVSAEDEVSLASGYQLLSRNQGVFFVALQATGRFEVVSAPQLVTSDGVIAQFGCARDVLVDSGEELEDRPEASEGAQQVGVELAVEIMPRIASAGEVVLEIASEIRSEFGGASAVEGIGDSGDLMEMSVRLQQGQSVCYRGFLREGIVWQEEKVPILGDLLLIGGLFRSSSYGPIMREWLVFITPRVVMGADQQVSVGQATSKR